MAAAAVVAACGAVKKRKEMKNGVRVSTEWLGRSFDRPK
jgi:hypothetical protein